MNMIKKILHKQLDVNSQIIKYNFNVCNIYDHDKNNLFIMQLLKYIEEIDLSLNNIDYELESLYDNKDIECSVSSKEKNIFQIYIENRKDKPLRGSCDISLKAAGKLTKKCKINYEILSIEIILTIYNTIIIDDLQKILAEKILLKWFKKQWPDLNLIIHIK